VLPVLETIKKSGFDNTFGNFLISVEKPIFVNIVNIFLKWRNFMFPQKMFICAFLINTIVDNPN